MFDRLAWAIQGYMDIPAIRDLTPSNPRRTL